MSIDNEVNEAIKQVAKAKMAEALGGDVLSKIVEEVMSHRDRNHYGSKDDKTFLDQMIHDSVADLIRSEVHAHVKNNEELRLKVKESIESKADEFASSVMDAFGTDDWRASLNVTINRKDDNY